MTLVTSRRDPDARGYFGEFGGRYVPETLVEPVEWRRGPNDSGRCREQMETGSSRSDNGKRPYLYPVRLG